MGAGSIGHAHAERIQMDGQANGSATGSGTGTGLGGNVDGCPLVAGSPAPQPRTGSGIRATIAQMAGAQR